MFHKNQSVCDIALIRQEINKKHTQEVRELSDINFLFSIWAEIFLDCVYYFFCFHSFSSLSLVTVDMTVKSFGQTFKGFYLFLQIST